MSLSQTEKDDLLKIIEIIYGHSSDVRGYKNSFNEETVLVVEEALAALVQCNSNMKSLVVGLLGGANVFVRGWLRKIIGKVRRSLEQEEIKLHGIACKNVAASGWKSAIVISTY